MLQHTRMSRTPIYHLGKKKKKKKEREREREREEVNSEEEN
jgi:hypothetical protein